jgi:hypothetical protein
MKIMTMTMEMIMKTTTTTTIRIRMRKRVGTAHWNQYAVYNVPRAASASPQLRPALPSAGALAVPRVPPFLQPSPLGWKHVEPNCRTQQHAHSLCGGTVGKIVVSKRGEGKVIMIE